MNYTNYQKTKTYQYNSRGNVTKVKEYDYTRGSLGELEGQETFSLEYTDGVWLDEMNLTVDGQSLFSYDDIGNTTQMDFAGLEWENGRQLAEMNVVGYDYAFMTNTYDDEGIRTSKTSGSNNTTYYTTESGKITSQYHLNPDTGEKEDAMLFLYDGEELIAAEYQNRTYYYVKNAMGDVISILNEEGVSIVDYAYNAWGDVVKKDIHNTHASGTDLYYADNGMAQYNPMTYRSYYCDETNGMYYLQSRYYMPSFCRFLNADIPDIAQQSKGDINGLNLFAYCNNDPVNKIDPSGYEAVSVAFGAIMGAMFGIMGYFLEIIVNNITVIFKNFSKLLVIIKSKVKISELLFNAGLGALNGALSTSAKLKGIAAIFGAVSTFIQERIGGSDIWSAIGIALITSLLTCFLDSTQSFSKFNFKRIGNAKKKIKAFNKKQIQTFAKELGKAVSYYLKSNKTLYKNYIVRYSLESLYSIATNLGLKKLYKRVFG